MKVRYFVGGCTFVDRARQSATIIYYKDLRSVHVGRSTKRPLLHVEFAKEEDALSIEMDSIADVEMHWGKIISEMEAGANALPHALETIHDEIDELRQAYERESPDFQQFNDINSTLKRVRDAIEEGNALKQRKLNEA